MFNAKDYLALLTQQGWKPKVTDDTPTLWRVEGVTSAGPLAECHAVGKGRELKVTVHGAGMTSAKVKALVAKFIARLP